MGETKHYKFDTSVCVINYPQTTVPCEVVCMMVRLAVLIEHWFETDNKRTDGQITRCISKAVQDRRLFSIKDEQQVIYRLSNGDNRQ